MVSAFNKLINALKTYDPEIDTSIGSNYRDLLINPLAIILQEYDAQVESVLKRSSALRLEDLTEEELEALALNYFVTKSPGTVATGTIKIYFKTPQALTLNKNTIFVDSERRRYFTVQNYSITKLQMDFNLDSSGLYHTNDIQVVSEKTGSENVRQIGDILQPRFTNALFKPVKVVVTSNFSGGSNGDSKIDFINKIKSAVLQKSAASATSLALKTINFDSNIKDAVVVGAGDEFMTRDLTSKGEAATVVENYLYVLSGLWTDPRSKGHVAYVDNFVQTSLSGILTLPNPDEWVTEFTDDMYVGLYKLDDSAVAEKDQYLLINIPQWTENIKNEFSVADAQNSDRSLVYPDEIKVLENSLVLGKTFQDNIDIQARVSLPILTQWSLDLEHALSVGDLETAKKIKENIKSETEIEKLTNVSPVIYKSITQHLGVQIDVTMSTTDATEFGEICYVTLLRNSVLTLPHDGYGLAWKKQPQYLIRLNKNEYTDDNLRESDIQKFIEDWGVNPETLGLIGNLSNPANSQYWKYNVYLVDNNILQEEIYIPFETLLDQTSGKNQFLQMAKVWIEPETSYDFRIKIYETMATKIWVKPSFIQNFTDTEHLKIDLGATYPNYLPSSGTKITTPEGVEILNSTLGAFGIGVSETRGYIWTIGRLSVRSFIQTFPMHLFKINLDLNKWNLNDSAVINWWGYGYDPDIPNQGAAQLFVYNPSLETPAWEPLGENLADPSSNPDLKKISGTIYNINNYLNTESGKNWIYVAASAKNFGLDFSQHLNHSLASQYIEIKNPLTESFHRGNCVDVWCWAPSQIQTYLNDYTVNNTDAYIELNIPYLTDIIEIREAFSQIPLNNNEWYTYNLKSGESWGPNAQIKIVLDSKWAGAKLTVVYKAWAGGDNITTQLNSDSIRYPAISVLAKTCIPWIIDIKKLNYKGSLGLDTAKQLIKEWIWSQKTLEKSDLINLLYDNGADYVDLDMEIFIKKYNINFYYTEDSMPQKITVPNKLTKFYTSDEYLLGVLNV